MSSMPPISLCSPSLPPGHPHTLREEQACQGAYAGSGSSIRGTVIGCGSSPSERVAPVSIIHWLSLATGSFYQPEHKQLGRLQTRSPGGFLGTCKSSNLRLNEAIVRWPDGESTLHCGDHAADVVEAELLPVGPAKTRHVHQGCDPRHLQVHSIDGVGGDKHHGTWRMMVVIEVVKWCCLHCEWSPGSPVLWREVQGRGSLHWKPLPLRFLTAPIFIWMIINGSIAIISLAL